MSTVFQSCPGCDSLILSDTNECPQCGHVLNQKQAPVAAESSPADRRKYQEMFDTCPKCGEQVRAGLVRCWSCNAFMRADVEAKYKELTERPQQIIFSDIPADQRTEYIPSRSGQVFGGYGRDVYDAEDDDSDFTLTEELQSPISFNAPPTPPPTAQLSEVPDGPDAPKSTTPEGKTGAAAPQKPAAQTSGTANASAEAQPAKKTDEGAKASSPGDAAQKSPQDVSVDELLGIAVKDQAETRRRQREKIEESRRRRILMPCSCGAWMRVSEDQAGRIVRCRKCKKPFIVPEMRKKEKASKEESQAGPKVNVTWLENVRLHVITPTEVVLKPGSLEKTFVEVDAAFHESGLHLIQYAAPAKKSLFGKGGDGPPAVEQQKQEIRDHIQKTGAISNLPYGTLLSVTPDVSSKIRLIQPVAEAHDSMFAGVPVFGEGQIVLYLPVAAEENKQSFVSLSLSVYRTFAAELQKCLGVAIPAKENGVPDVEEHDTLTCHLSEVKIPAAKNIVYYKNDPGFDVELSGYVCGTCGIAITEEARARKKLGGGSAKGLPKAKCPKCTNKFGDQQVFKVTAKKSAESDEGEAETA